MKIGDLVKLKHDRESVGLITHVDPVSFVRGRAVSYKVKVAWSHSQYKCAAVPQYSWQLEVINAQD